MPPLISPAHLAPAVDSLRRGEIVAFPTESSYGLGVDMRNEAALHRLYRLKNRPTNKPLLVLSPSADVMAEQLAASVPAAFVPLLRLWPGALTLIFPAHASVSSVVTGGTGTIGIRCSPHPVAAALVAAFGGAITATSANLSGVPPCTSAAEVVAMFDDGVDAVVDGGRADGVPSTLVGVDGDALVILREGQVARSEVCS